MQFLEQGNNTLPSRWAFKITWANLLVFYLLACAPLGYAQALPKVVLETNLGNIKLELYDHKAPVTVKNFLSYVREGFYDDTVFHRVIPRFIVQGGGFDKGYRQKKTRDPIVNEANNGLPNLRGSFAMARFSEKDSATAQFFINLVDNAFLNHDVRDFGYAVFGRVTEGMNVVDKMATLETGRLRGMANVPKEVIYIRRAWVEGEKNES